MPVSGLTPVDYDPFAAPVAPKVTPVDYDPFADQALPGTVRSGLRGMQPAADVSAETRNFFAPSVGPSILDASPSVSRVLAASAAPAPQQVLTATPAPPEPLQPDGELGRVGYNVRRGAHTVNAGIFRAAEAVARAGGADKVADFSNFIATRGEEIAARPIEGNVEWNDLKTDPSIGNLSRFVMHQGAASLPGMGLAVTGPVGFGSYVTSQAGNIGQQRAENNGTGNIGLGDLITAGPAAGLSAVFERAGARGIGAPGAGGFLANTGRAALGEAGTEFGQGIIEYGGGTLGTDAGFDPAMAAEMGLAGAIVGGPMGGGLHAGIHGPAALAEQIQLRRAMNDVGPLPGPTADQAAIDALAPAQPALEPIPSAFPTAQAPAPQPAVPAVTLTPVEGDPFATPEPNSQLAVAQPRPADEPQPAAGPFPGDGLRPDPGELAEGERYVTTPAGNRIRSRFEVVPLASLRQADGDLQNRDRSRDTTELQVNDIVANFDPSRLGESAESDRGAPIVGPDGVIESGNGRILALGRVYGDTGLSGSRDSYHEFLRSGGHDISGIDNPVLIRRRTSEFTPEQRRQFVIDSNKDAKLALTSVERAKSDADALDSGTLELYRGGDVTQAGNGDFVKAFISRMTPSERASLIDDKRALSQEGIARIENALMARAYENPAVLSKLMEARDNNIRSIGTAMLDNAGGWSKLRAAVKDGTVKPEFDITERLVEAAQRVSDARSRGEKIGDVLSQNDAFNQMDPVTELFVRSFYSNKKGGDDPLAIPASREAISSVLTTYTKRAQEQTTGERLFAGDDVTPEELLSKVLDEQRGGGQAGLFAQAAEDKGLLLADELDRRLTARKAARAERRPAPIEEDGDIDEDIEEDADYQPSFAAASFTNRRSDHNTAAVDFGIEPERFALMPAPKQVQVLKEAIMRRFGIAVTVKPGLQERFAIDQMLDAYQNVHGMAHVLGLPLNAMSLGGKLKLELVKNARFLGAYSHGASTIYLPKRSNSFAHEWGHAIDYHLMDRMGTDPARGLTGLIRSRGSEAVTDPANLREAFVDLLNTMFFDKAEVATKIMEIERRIAASKSDKVKTELQAQIDRFKTGSSQSRTGRSQFYKNAATFDGPTGDYWQSPTEMFARAFEAYVSYKADMAGLGTEFIGKGDANYLSNAEERFAKTFPKDAERDAIFNALDQVFEIISREATVSQPAAERPLPSQDGMPVEPREGGWLQRQVANEVGAWMDRRTQHEKGKADRIKDPKSLARKAQDVAAFFGYGMTAEMKMIGRRYKSPTIAKLHNMLEFTTGTAKMGAQPRGFTQAARLAENRAFNQVHKAFEDYAPRDKRGRPREMTADEDRMLRDLLISEGGTLAGRDNLVALAARLRKQMDDVFYQLQQVGVDVGYTRNGYLMRIPDMPKILHNEAGFLTQAGKVYGVKFDKDIGTEANDVLSDEDTLKTVLKMAAHYAKNGYKIDGLGEVRALLKEIKALGDRMKTADDPDALQAKVDEKSERLEEVMGELLDSVRKAYSEQSAIDWLARLKGGGDDQFDSRGPQTSFLKKRELPPEADKLLEDFYVNNPREVVETYTRAAARRIEYARLFGADSSKLKEMYKAMLDEGVPGADIDTIRSIVEIVTGRNPSAIKGPVLRNFASALRFVYGTAALLPRATFASLAEPLAMGIVTGRPLRGGLRSLAATASQGLAQVVPDSSKPGLHPFWSQLEKILDTANARQRRKIAQIAGLVNAGVGGNVMAERFGGLYGDHTFWDKLSDRMFYNSGLTALTRAQATGNIAPAHAFLMSMAQDINKAANGATLTGRAKKDFDEATARYKELGISDAEAFANNITSQGMPTLQELEQASIEPDKHQYANDWITAINRMQRQAVQEPSAMSRPRAASHPVGQFVYGIMAFNYEQWRNIAKGTAIRTWEQAERSGPGFTAEKLAFGILPAVGAVVMGAVLTSFLREYLTNRRRFEERKAAGTLAESMLALGTSRAFGTPFDPITQAATGMKYNRDPALMLLGPTLGNMGQNVSDVGKLAIRNSPNTNTAEHNATRGAYRLLSPWGVAALSTLPGGPVMAAGYGLTAGAITAPQAGVEAGNLLVGEKKKRGGKKRVDDVGY